MSTSQTQHSPVSSESSDDSGKQLITWQESVVLLSISIKHLVVLTFVPSILSLILVFVIGFGIDYLELLNYEWTCGKVLLPSFSRIINLPIERIIWHMGIMTHITIRPIFIVQSYVLNSRSAKHSSIYIVKFLAFVALISGILELVFTIALTVVGERESGTLHVGFFIAFISSCATNQVFSVISCRLSRSYKEDRQVRFCLKVRVGLFVLMLILIPLIFLFFVLYWKYCVRFAYDLFATLEYLAIFTVYAYHIVSVFDLKRFECHIVKCKK